MIRFGDGLVDRRTRITVCDERELPLARGSGFRRQRHLRRLDRPHRDERRELQWLLRRPVETDHDGSGDDHAAQRRHSSHAPIVTSLIDSSNESTPFVSRRGE